VKPIPARFWRRRRPASLPWRRLGLLLLLLIPFAARPHGDLPVVAELATLVDMAWARSTQARQLEGQGLEARTQA
jgi:hypothetical protein